MIFLLIANMILTFFCLCGLAAVDNRLNRIIDNQDIIKCIKKSK